MRRWLLPLLATTLAAEDPTYSVQSRRVLVPVTVTDRKGRAVDGLEAGSFVVLDNGRPRQATVDTLATGVAPVALAIAVQSSGISAAALDKVRKIGPMIQPLVTGERGCAAVLAFDEQVRWLQRCTGNADSIARALARLQTGEPKEALST
jgi:hypothetical protein